MSLHNADKALGKSKVVRIKSADLRKIKSEEQIQVEVANWLDVKLPKDWRWYHPPNGGWRKKSTAGRLKAQGVKAGVADVVIMRPNGADVWVELKSFAGVLSPEQKRWRQWMLDNGRAYFVCRSVEDVAEVVASLQEQRRAA